VGPLGGTQYGTYAANWTYGTRMSVLDVRTWPRGDVPGLVLTDEDVGLLRRWIVTSSSRLNRIDRILIPIPSFPKAQLQRTLRLSVLDPEQF
jgi:hypothetical protein